MPTTAASPLDGRVRPIREPQPWIQAAGMALVPFEFGALMAALPWLPALRRGDGHPVMVIPGFMGGDMSTLPLRHYLQVWGYDVHGFGERPNPGPTPALLARLGRQLTDVHASTGCRVSIVGWSAGGRSARYLARQHPESVRLVITLGGGLQSRLSDRHSISFIADRVRHTFAPGFGDDGEHAAGPLPVPSTSIYSRIDGVVRWNACLDVVDELHENVEIYASHVGIGMNPTALFVIADRLAQPQGEWRPFVPNRVLRRLYPLAPSWDAQRAGREP